MPEHDLRVFGEADEATVQQMENCLDGEPGAIGVLCADNHLGYSQPIGGVVAYREHVSPTGVGYDIGCGNKAVKTGLTLSDVKYDVAGIMEEITRRVSFGVGRTDGSFADHPVIDAIREAEFAPQRQLADLAGKQLGTVGAGNHYVDIFVDDASAAVWIGVHFGSRGFGHKTASGFMAIADGKSFEDRPSGGEMMTPPKLLRTDSDEGQAYIVAMELAGRYAYAGRDMVCETVLDILGTESKFEVHNHHNFAWHEEHGGETFWVVRKGATPAWPGQQGFVGSSMAEDSVLLIGDGGGGGAEALFSTIHGAGRAMSRNKAAGKFRKRWACQDRDCERLFEAEGNRHPKKGLCPDHPEARIKKVKVRVGGAVDWDDTLADLRARGVHLVGGAADEAPLAYKRLPDVLEAHDKHVSVTRTLRPIGVAMAPDRTFDPYKD